MKTIKTPKEIAEWIFNRWNSEYQYPMAWGSRVDALKMLIEIAIEDERRKD